MLTITILVMIETNVLKLHVTLVISGSASGSRRSRLDVVFVLRRERHPSLALL